MWILAIMLMITKVQSIELQGFGIVYKTCREGEQIDHSGKWKQNKQLWINGGSGNRRIKYVEEQGQGGEYMRIQLKLRAICGVAWKSQTAEAS